MFVRKRIRSRLRGRGGDPGAGKIIAYYQVLESVRVKGKPRHRVVASWCGRPSLAQAIAAAEMWQRWSMGHLERYEAALACGRPRLAVPRARHPHQELEQEIKGLHRRLEMGRAKIERLRQAHA